MLYEVITAKQKQVNDGQSNFVTLFGQAFEELDPNARLAAIFNTIELKDKVNFNSTNEEVLEILKAEAESAISNSFNILRTRIDRFGVTQPNIHRITSYNVCYTKLLRNAFFSISTFGTPYSLHI